MKLLLELVKMNNLEKVKQAAKDENVASNELKKNPFGKKKDKKVKKD